MLISLATMDFRLCHLLREKLSQKGFSIEQLQPGDPPSKDSILIVTTEEESNQKNLTYSNMVVLSKVETLNLDKAYSKIMLGIEGKKIWESLIIGVDPGLTIGVAVITDGCLQSTLETRNIKETVNFILLTLKNLPAKMAIIRIGSTGGYRQILILNELLNVKPEHVDLEVVDELHTTPERGQEANEIFLESVKEGMKIPGGKDATAAMQIAFRLGESVKEPETCETSDGELKEIQVLSRQYSRGDVTISRELAIKVASGRLTLEEAISIQKSENKQS